MSELLTNFKDDILAESMEGRRRYQMITNEDGTVSFVDVTEYEQVGSEFGQAEINVIHRAINNKLDSGEVIDPLAAEEAGFAADAKLTGDALREVSAKIEWKLLGTKSSPTYAALQIPIPEDLDFSELSVMFESYNAGNYIFNIPRQALTPAKGIRQGFYSSANLTGFASLNVSETTIQMGSYNQNGVTPTNVVMTVYYR